MDAIELHAEVRVIASSHSRLDAGAHSFHHVAIVHINPAK